MLTSALFRPKNSHATVRVRMILPFHDKVYKAYEFYYKQWAFPPDKPITGPKLEEKNEMPLTKSIEWCKDSGYAELVSRQVVIIIINLPIYGLC